MGEKEKECKRMRNQNGRKRNIMNKRKWEKMIMSKK
jgi:hypothetical protein